MLNIKIAEPTPFARAMAEYRSVNAEYGAFLSHQEQQLEAFNAACDALPHERTEISYLDHAGERVTLSTESPTIYGLAHDIIERLTEVGDLDRPQKPDYVAALQEIIALQDKRELEIEALRKRFQLADLECEDEEWSDRLSDLGDVVRSTPVSSVNELLEKIQFLNFQDLLLAEAHGTLVADAQALIKAGESSLVAGALEPSTAQ